MPDSATLQEAPLLKSWWRERPVWVMLFLGFSAGLPILLIFGTLSLWLREAGVSRSTATYFSWAILGYSFKFVWAPLIDRLPIPYLTVILGKRRAWMLCAQVAIMTAILMMAMTDPVLDLTLMAWAAVLLGFASATQDVVIDAFRIESAEPRLQAMLASAYIAGYRIGMIVAGAMALFLAEYFGSTLESYSYAAWQRTYFLMAAVMLIGVATTLSVSEPKAIQNTGRYELKDYLSFFLVFITAILIFISAFALFPDFQDSNDDPVCSFTWSVLRFITALSLAFFTALFLKKLGLINHSLFFESYQQPIKDFFNRYGSLAIWVLLLIGFYRISDIVMGVIANVFYQDMGYSKIEIASVSKVFGVVMTITGSFLGGLFALRIGVLRALQGAAVLVVLTNLLFCWLALVGQSHTDVDLVLPLIGHVYFPLELTLAITLDNLVQGLSLAAFIAWLSALTSVSFTATQYAIFSSLMTMLPKVIGGYSGTLVDSFGYINFFLFASCIGVPVIVLIHFLGNKLSFEGGSKR